MTVFGIITTAVAIFILVIRFLTVKKEKHNGNVKRKVKTDVSWVPKSVASDTIFSIIVNLIFGR